jgi:molybdopterin molybdotransferase
VGRPLPPGKVYNANEVALWALVSRSGGIPRVLGIAHDDERSITYKMLKGLEADVIITTGGVSKGDYDLTRKVIGKMGKLLFSRILNGPAFAFGLVEKPGTDNENSIVPIIAIEGPPPGCLIDFEILVRPALLKMRGILELGHPAVEAVCEESMADARPMSAYRWTVLKKTESGYTVGQSNDSGLVLRATANSLTIIPAGTILKTGDKIPVWPLDWNK